MNLNSKKKRMPLHIVHEVEMSVEKYLHMDKIATNTVFHKLVMWLTTSLFAIIYVQ